MLVDESNWDRGWFRVGDRLMLRVITDFDLALFDLMEQLGKSAARFAQDLAVKVLKLSE